MRIGGKYHARKRRNGTDVYGPARRRKAEAEADLKGLVHPVGGSRDDCPTLGEWAYMQMKGTYGSRLAESSFRTVETIRINHLNASKLAKRRLDKIDHRELQAWLDTIPAGPHYVRRVAAFVSKLYSLAERDDWVDRNPMKKVDLPRIEERENRVLTAEELVRLMNPTDRTGIMALIAVHTGMRRGELVRLKWSDLRDGLIHVPGTKSAAAKRIVPMTPEVERAFELLPRRGETVFTTEEGGMLDLRNTNRDFSRWKKQMGFPRELRLHDLRGSYASFLLHTGADVRTVMELMGHADSRTTMKMYARSNLGAKVEAVRRISCRGVNGKQ